jgi:hypothetical protein
MPIQVYDGSPEAFRCVRQWLAEGMTLACPKCGAALIVAIDRESAVKNKVHPGIYCSVTPRHFFEIIELKSPERDRIRSEWRKRAAEEMDRRTGGLSR